MIIKKFLFKKDWFFDEEFKLEKKASFILGAQVEKKIYSGKSKFQELAIFENKHFGRILALDGLVQFSTKHEFVYHEMLVHPAFFYHSKPEKILIIGGGDGGVLREVIKYKTVKEIFLADIDEKVTEVSKKYLPSLSDGAFNDKRLKLFFADALDFVKKFNGYFDVIIDDLTDPTGTSFALWSAKFYLDVSKALKEDGIASFQTAYLGESFARKARGRIKKVFPFFKVHKAYVGCFPFDEHTFSLGSKRVDFNKFCLKEIKNKFQKLNLKTKYYFPEIHFSSAILTKF